MPEADKAGRSASAAIVRAMTSDPLEEDDAEPDDDLDLDAVLEGLEELPDPEALDLDALVEEFSEFSDS